MDFLISALSGLLGGTVISAAILWLTKEWLTERLKASIQNEYAVKLVKIKSELEIQVANASHALELQKESHIAAMQVLGKKDEIRFASYHEKQAALITELYTTLVDLHWHALGVIPGGANFAIDKVPKLVEAIQTVDRHIKRNQIYFSDALSDMVFTLLNSLHELCIKKQTVSGHDDAAFVVMKQSWETLSQEQPALLAKIRTELKMVLGEKD